MSLYTKKRVLLKKTIVINNAITELQDKLCNLHTLDNEYSQAEKLPTSLQKEYLKIRTVEDALNNLMEYNPRISSTRQIKGIIDALVGIKDDVLRNSEWL
jgi:hypothetical protein